MQKRTTWGVCFLILGIALLTIVPAQAQMAPPPSKPPIYIYVSTWAVPRAQWPDVVKLDATDKSVDEKLLANGTIVGYGAYTNLIHQEGEPTHGSWFTATSEGNLMKALEAYYANPGSTDSPVEAASKHWDLILTGDIYNSKPGTSGGYLTWSEWQVKPGQMKAYADITKKLLVPVLEKLLADGAITSYGEMTNDYHSGRIGVVYDYFTVPDAAALDKANKAFDDAFEGNPALTLAYRELTEQEGHHDYLTRLRTMSSK